MKRRIILLITILISAGFLYNCGEADKEKDKETKVKTEKKDTPLKKEEGTTMEEKTDTKAEKTAKSNITASVIDKTIDEMVKKYGNEVKDRITTGVKQVADKWRENDGDAEKFKEFCINNFVKEKKKLQKTFLRYQDNLEQIYGHLHEIRRFINEPIQLTRHEKLPTDKLFANFSLNTHVIEDLYKTKLAFWVLLNFKQYTLEEKLKLGKDWSRDEWAYARLADLFVSRVPPSVKQKIKEAYTGADDYISNYNVYMHHLLTEDGKRLFKEGLKLISHWGLRDEIKAQYANKDALPKQEMIYQVMNKILNQSIPKAVIDNPYVDWVVETNEVKKTTAKDIDLGKHLDKKDVPISNEPEDNTRYQHLLNVFKASTLADPYYKTMPTYIDRKFKMRREIPKKEVENLLISVLSAPVMEEVGKLVEKRLGRKLQPFDIWYNGFKARSNFNEEKLDKIVKQKYPSTKAFQKDLPNILKGIGFDKNTASFLASKITVDPSRGAGHASGAQRREDNAHLRTRIPKDGMNYKGYNIAIHELGHNVEQVFSLNKIDHYMLEGVPNTAFTEGFAFTFQARDFDLLGMTDPSPELEHLKVLDSLWNVFEISGVGLVDIGIWDWMYKHPDAKPSEVKDAIINIAKDVWNKYFARIYGVKDIPILCIYSHIIDAGMYVPDYPIGFLIQFQMEDFFKKSSLAKEMERMCKLGSITPDAWMRNAVGSPISAEPIIKAAEVSVKEIAKQ